MPHVDALLAAQTRKQRAGRQVCQGTAVRVFVAEPREQEIEVRAEVVGRQDIICTFVSQHSFTQRSTDLQS